MKKFTIGFSAIMLLFALSLSSCTKSFPFSDSRKTSINTKDSLIIIRGEGSSFPAPLYQLIFDTLKNEKGIQVHFQQTGSERGIRQLIDKSIDFSISEAPMKLEQIEKAGSAILQIPFCTGAVAVAYHLNSQPSLKFDTELLSKIFMGDLRRWNDPALQRLNPGVHLPDEEILVVHRLDGAGTTFAFAEYLTKTNTEWASAMGSSSILDWPLGIASLGNEGVAESIRNIPNSIGYLELNAALQNNLSIGAVKNNSGNYIVPSLESIEQAVKVELPDQLILSLSDTSAPMGYPIVTMSWIIAYREQKNTFQERSSALSMANMLWWIVNERQGFEHQLHYGKVPFVLNERVKTAVKTITFEEKLLLR